MATPLLIGIGALAAAVGGRHLLRQRAGRLAEQWVRGGFQAKMDRREAILILGLKCVYSPPLFFCLSPYRLMQRWSFSADEAEGSTPTDNDCESPRPRGLPVPGEQDK
jgi:hypothetical protein